MMSKSNERIYDICSLYQEGTIQQRDFMHMMQGASPLTCSELNSNFNKPIKFKCTIMHEHVYRIFDPGPGQPKYRGVDPCRRGSGGSCDPIPNLFGEQQCEVDFEAMT